MVTISYGFVNRMIWSSSWVIFYPGAEFAAPNLVTAAARRATTDHLLPAWWCMVWDRHRQEFWDKAPR